MFGLMGGDFDDDFLGNHMNAMNMQMRSMNRLMNTFMPDPFNMLAPFPDPGFQQQNALMERGGPAGMGGLFSFPAMPNMNRLLSADIGSPMTSFCSSSVMTMSSGPDGRPQIYQATSSTKTGPGGIRETRKTVQDSTRGLKKMAIGHHIGERAHIIEKEQDLRSGQLEERQEFINLDEDEAEDFDREFTTRARRGSARGGPGGVPAIRGRPQQMLTIEPVDDDDDDDVVEEVPQQTHVYAGRQQQSRRQLPELPAPPAAHQQNSSVSSASTSAALHDALSNNITSRVHNNTANINHNNNNNNYIGSSGNRRSAAYHRLANAAGGATPRRPLRTPPASPLATSPTSHNHSTASTPSVHPHPYNAAAARRNHRPKHTLHQQKAATTEKQTGAVKKSKTEK